MTSTSHWASITATTLGAIGVSGGIALLKLLVSDPASTAPHALAEPARPADPADCLRGTLPAASDLRLGTLFEWTSSSAVPTKQISIPRAR
ncbi:hypothetical protein [Kitasatospora kifunensis]|uniref:Uncharacterized protein n=1 Tax=Kitasatospora kifunensis TaxID=58351 RepID=A0A7W7R1E8_KITKI|nr:hypothetical protein [Kitasatospora kifunensis]MBB4923635.1 hypothetical protein [Kitasatospora kifunensis]